MAFGVNGPHSLLQPIPPHNDRNRQLAGALGDRDDIDILLRDRRKDTPRNSRESSHSFADYRQQSDFPIDLDAFNIAMRQFQRQSGLNGLRGVLQFLVSDQKTEALTIAG